jgi:hypothetical protein
VLSARGRDSPRVPPVTGGLVDGSLFEGLFFVGMLSSSGL